MILVVGPFMVSPLDMVMGFQVPGPEECLKAMEPVDPLPETLCCAFDPAVDFDPIRAPHPSDGEPMVILRNHSRGGNPDASGFPPRVPPFKTLQAGLTAFGGEAGGEIGFFINSQHSLHPLNWQRSSLVRLHHASAGRSPHKGVRGNVVPPAGL